MERSALRTPDDVDRMLQLHALGWGVKRIARELGYVKNTVKKCATQGDWRPAAPLARVGTAGARVAASTPKIRLRRPIPPPLVRKDIYSAPTS